MPFYYLNSNTTSPLNAFTTTSTGLVVPNQYVLPTTAATSNFVYYPTSALTTTTTLSSTFTGTSYVFYTDNSVSYNRSQLYETLKAKKGPLIKKSIRSSIKKAVKLISNFGMEEDLKIFLGGDKIELSHPDSDFKFLISKKPDSLIRYTERCVGHTPYNLLLYTKSDVFIADLCVFMRDTPILDQILAVSMFVKSGNEEDLLVKANYNRLTNNKELRKTLALENPHLRNKLRADFIDV